MACAPSKTRHRTTNALVGVFGDGEVEVEAIPAPPGDDAPPPAVDPEAPFCSCGHAMVRNGPCFVCTNCGEKEGGCGV